MSNLEGQNEKCAPEKSNPDNNDAKSPTPSILPSGRDDMKRRFEDWMAEGGLE